MTTLIFTHPACMEHDPGPGHPESPARLKAVLEALHAPQFAALAWREARRASGAEIERVHDRAYIAEVMAAVPQAGRVSLDLDTAVSPGSGEAALRAAGALCGAVDAVAAGEGGNAFCAVRPPGHHARPAQGMGFCIFNSIAVAARYAQRQHGIGKVMIADWDVHHGNGTQDTFYEDGSVFFFSTHQWPWYPGTGPASETGEGAGKGTTMNRPFPAGAGRAQIVGAFREDLRRAADQFKPELVLISAGFDSRLGDPLGGFRLSDQDFTDLTATMLEVAGKHAGGRLVSILEGGYDLDGLAAATVAHVRALVGGSA